MKTVLCLLLASFAHADGPPAFAPVSFAQVKAAKSGLATPAARPGDARSDFHIGCFMNETSVNAYTADGKVYLSIQIPKGFDGFPIYSGTLTPGATWQVTAALKDLRVLDGSVVVSWDRSQCRVGPGLLMGCDGPGSILTPADSGLKTYTLSTSLEHSVGLSFSADVVRFNWSVDTADGAHYFISFPFAKESCGRSSDKPKRASKHS